MKKKLIIAVCMIALLGLALGIIDYYRIRKDKTPLFMIRVTDGRTEKDSYLGFGYKMERIVGVSSTQPLSQSISIKFGLWFYTWDIPVPETNYK
jgi:hypothetical protein